MKTALATIADISNPKDAALRLWKDIQDNIEIEENSAGILFCDADDEPWVLSGYLHEISGIDIFGGTSVAMIDSLKGYSEFSAVFLVLTGTQERFSVTLSEAYDEQSAVDKLLSAYNENVLQNEGTTPAMVFLLMNFISGTVSDKILETLSEAAVGAPIFGGMPTAFGPENMHVFINGSKYFDRALIMNIFGQIKPLFLVKNITRDFFGRKFKTTKTENHIIYEVDHIPFTEYLESMGIDVNAVVNEPNGIFYHSNPLYIEKEVDGGAIISYTRVIESLDVNEKSGLVYSDIPENTTIRLVTLREEDIGVSAQMLGKDIAELIQENEADGYKYTTAICVSCYGRYLVAASQHDRESAALLENLPKGINMAGFYSYGEICPLTVNTSHNNLLHNCSVALCVF